MSKFDTGLSPEQYGVRQKTDVRIKLNFSLVRRLSGLCVKEGLDFDKAVGEALEKLVAELEAKQKIKREHGR